MTRHQATLSRAYQDPAAAELHSGRPRERAIAFGADPTLVGVLTEPAPAAADRRLPTAVFVTAGMLHRVGPNRLYVTLARRLAAHGFPTVRFDLSGIGDSGPRSDGLPAEQAAVQDIRLVLNALEEEHGARSFVLIGLCSGAVNAFNAALVDDRVGAVVLINPQGFVHDAAWNAHVATQTDARRYLARSVFRIDSWRRAVTGRIGYRRLVRVLAARAQGVARQPEVVSPIAAKLRGGFAALTQRGVEVLVVCSEGDSSLDYMALILGRSVARGVDAERFLLRLFPASDHSLTLASAQRALFGLLDEWVERFTEAAA